MLNVTISIDLGTYASACGILIERADGGEFFASEARGNTTRLRLKVVCGGGSDPFRKELSELKSLIGPTTSGKEVMKNLSEVAFREDDSKGLVDTGDSNYLAWCRNYKLVLYPVGTKQPAGKTGKTSKTGKSNRDNPENLSVPFQITHEGKARSDKPNLQNMSPLKDVYLAAYRLLLQAAFRRVATNIGSYKGDYCLRLIGTIPVITSQQAMSFIKKIITEAADSERKLLEEGIAGGHLVPPEDSDAGPMTMRSDKFTVSLSFEPEGAFRSAIHELPQIFDTRGETRSIVVDLGGGTMDILALLNITDVDASGKHSYRVSEICTAGDAVGGAFLDSELIKFLTRILTEGGGLYSNKSKVKFDAGEERKLEEVSCEYREHLKLNSSLTKYSAPPTEGEPFWLVSEFLHDTDKAYKDHTHLNIKHSIEIPIRAGSLFHTPDFCRAIDAHISNCLAAKEEEYANQNNGKTPSAASYLNTITIYPETHSVAEKSALDYIDEVGAEIPKGLTREKLAKIPYGQYYVYYNREGLRDALWKLIEGEEGVWKVAAPFYYDRVVTPFLRAAGKVVQGFLDRLETLFKMDAKEAQAQNALETNRTVVNPVILKIVQDRDKPWNLIFAGGMSQFFPLRHMITSMISEWASRLYGEAFARESLRLVPVGNPSMAVVSGASMQCQMKYITAEMINRPSDSTYGIRVMKQFGAAQDPLKAAAELEQYARIKQKYGITDTSFTRDREGVQRPTIHNYLQTFIRAKEVPPPDFDNGIVVHSDYTDNQGVSIEVYAFSEPDIEIVKDGTKPLFSLTVYPRRPTVSAAMLDEVEEEIRSDVRDRLEDEDLTQEEVARLEQDLGDSRALAESRILRSIKIHYKVQLELHPNLVITVTQLAEDGTPVAVLTRKEGTQLTMY